MKKAIFFILLVSTCSNLFSQKEYYNWYFGQYAGITFNTPDLHPECLDSSAMDQFEGCSSISDSAGNLLFYSDGIKVWDRKHELIPGGDSLGGHYSSTQSALILKQPGSNGIYYVLTTGALYYDSTSGTKLNYAIIDLSLNASYGAVIEKGLLDSSSTEKISAVNHANGTDIWIITHEIFTDYFHKYLLTANGLEKYPRQKIGSDHYAIEKVDESGIGVMKFSPDGRKLALCVSMGQWLEIYDFDNVTGMLENHQRVDLDCKPYGLEFSPDSKKIYYTGNYQNASIVVYQYVLEFPDYKPYERDPNIELARDIEQYSGLQLAPDGKIYIAMYNCMYLGLIENPDKIGVESGIKADGFTLTHGISNIGLPNSLTSAMPVELYLKCEHTCIGDTFELHAELSFNFINPVFDWTGPNGFKAKGNPVIRPYSDETMNGWYHVTARYNIGSEVHEISDSIYMEIRPAFNFEITPGKQPPVICAGNPITLSVFSEDYLRFLWSTGDTTSCVTVSDSGLYWVVATDIYGCDVYRDIYIEEIDGLDIYIHGPEKICRGEEALLRAYDYSPDYSYLWSTGETGDRIKIQGAGTYSLIVEADNCFGYDTITVEEYDTKQVKIIGDTLCCPGDMVKLSLNNNYLSYYWSNGGRAKEITVPGGAEYYVMVYDDNGCKSYDTIKIELSIPEAVINGDTSLCEGDMLTLSSLNECETYLWSTGDTTREITIDMPGIYSLVLQNNTGCTDTAFIEISEAERPEPEIIGEKFICRGNSAILSADKDYAAYYWSTGETSKEIEISEAGAYYLIAENEAACTDTAFIDIEAAPKAIAELIGETAICKGSKTIISSQYEYPSYSWSTGDSGREITAKDSGDYYLIVTNDYGCSDTLYFRIDYLPGPELHISGSEKFCKGDETVLSASDEFTSYLWSTGETSRDIIIDEPGMYYLEVENQYGCKSRDSIFADYIISGLEYYPDILDFQYVYIDTDSTMSINIQNKGDFEISLFAAAKANTFKPDTDTLFIPPGDIGALNIKFDPELLIDYSDILTLSLIEPCRETYEVQLYGKGKAVLYVYIPDREAYIGEDICIPIYGKLLCEKEITNSSDYTALISFDASAFNSLLPGTINGGSREIMIEEFTTVNNSQSVIGEICGTVMIGDRDYSPVNIIDFNWTDDHIEIDTSGGSLSLEGMCVRNLSRLSTFIPTKLLISPNPANESVNVLIESEEIGNIELNIYNLQGAEVYKESWNNSGKTVKQININTDDFSNGAYSLVLKSSMSVIVRNLFINK